MAIDMKKFLARFTEEAGEHISKVNRELLELEKNPNDIETLGSVFRSVHTLKGSSRMMKLTSISEVAHRMEEILASLREGRMRLSKGLSDVLFAGIDAIAEMVESVGSGTEIKADIQPVCAALEKASRQESETEKSAASAGETPEEQAPFEEPTPAAPVKATQVVLSEPDKPSAKPKTSENTIRVHTARLDGLMKLSGEMVTCHNRLKRRLGEIKEMEKLAGEYPRLPSCLENGESSAAPGSVFEVLRSLHARLKQLTFELNEDFNAQENLIQELKEEALWMRMLPLSTLFETLHRTVRDIAGSLEKKVELVVEGGETMLDKKMIEGIADPLVHMIRNAIDHGIEKPRERLEGGKCQTGVIRISARNEGGSVLIELSDDGAGIPVGRLKEKALQKKLFHAEELEKMSETQTLDLIFHPGLSTSGIVTDISGRGVGMDVVKRNVVDQLKGTIHVETEQGKGSTFEIRLLLTLATMDVLLVRVSEITFALPAGCVAEIVRVPQSELIDVIDRKAIRLREQIIPVVSLGHVLGLPAEGMDEKGDILLLVLSVNGQKLGTVVDTVMDEANVVMKPLPAHMQENRLVAGVATWGRDEVVSILSGSEIFSAAREIRYEKHAPKSEPNPKGTVHILVVDDSLNTREIEKSILEAYGYNVTLAADGMEALEKAGEVKYDLIVTDIEMPRLDGFSLTERLRGDEEYKETPIVLVTSRDRDSDKRRGIKVGADAYIVKGAFDQSNLIDTIKNLVGESVNR